MSCSWLYLASRTTPERFCDKPGHPYCEEHQREMDAMEQVDKDWDEILASLQAVCEEPKRRTKALRRVQPPPGRTDTTPPEFTIEID